MNPSKYLFFDIETEANKPVLELMPEPQVPANYKDPEKIAAYIAEKKLELADKAALDPDYGRIVAISYQYGWDSSVKNSWLVRDSDTEVKALKDFWNVFKFAANGYSCGYNIIGFDLPYLLRRSMDLGVKVPMVPFMAKYRTEPTLDLMGVLYGWGQAKSLKFVCKRYGIPNELPELEGSQVANMDYKTLVAYCENDVRLVMALYDKMDGVYF